MPSVSPRKGIDIDDSNLMGHLHDYALVLGKSLGEVVREQAGLFCMDLVAFTHPFKSPGQGMTSEAKKKGLANVEKSVFKIFAPIDKATSSQIAAIGRYDVFKLWAKSNTTDKKDRGPKAWQSFQSRHSGGRQIPYLDADSSQMRKIHFKNRRFNGKGGLQPYAIRAKTPFAFVKNEKVIKTYVREHQKFVGSFKSAYWFAAQKIRAKEVRAPAWIRHQRGNKFAIGIDQIQQPKKPEATVGSIIGKRAMPVGLVRRAISKRAYAMRFVMARELNKRKMSLWEATARGMTVNTARYF